MSKVRLCFMGTPDFAVHCLNSLLSDEHYQVVGVVTQPDRPAGRKLQLTPSPVKVLAHKHALPVLTPESLRREPEMVAQIQSWKADVAVVVAFGQILTEEFMQMFPYGCVNVHASLLPRWRGAAPIQRAIEHGDAESGVCLQRMVKKLDAGDILGERKIKIDHTINSLELHDQLAQLSTELLTVELMDYLRGNLAARSQNESLVTYAHKIDKTESFLDLASHSARKLHDKVRAFVWGPGTYLNEGGARLKIHRTMFHDEQSQFAPGSVARVSENSFFIQTAEGLLEVIEVQPESRQRQSARDYIQSKNLKVGYQFSSSKL